MLLSSLLKKNKHMLENILQMVREFGENEVVNNPAVPNEHNNAVMSEASMAVAGTLQQALANGNVNDIMSLFNQGDNGSDVMANPISQQMQNGFIDNITSKLGIDGNTASGLAGSLLPMIMNTLVKRTNSQAPEDSGFNLNSLIGSLTGGGGQGGGGLDIGGLINQFTGGGGGSTNQNGGGGFDIGDIINQVSGGAKQDQGGGGLANIIQGFFGK
jgi:uncharacterized protein YidB (DUF937 family)